MSAYAVETFTKEVQRNSGPTGTMKSHFEFLEQWVSSDYLIFFFFLRNKKLEYFPREIALKLFV